MSDDDDLDSDSSEEECWYIIDNLVISFDEKKQKIPFSKFKLENFCFKPLTENIDTLFFCAFFANHFYYFHSYSYFISASGVIDFYDESTIGDKEHFTLKKPDFISFSPILYYKDECLLDINNFIRFTSSISHKDAYQSKLIENEEDLNKNFLLVKALIELIEDAGSYYYDKISPIKSEEEIKRIIENDYNSDFIPRLFIFQIETEIPYRVAVKFNVKDNPMLVTDFNFRIVWGICEDKLIYIDDDEIFYEFDLEEKSFINQGKNETLNFEDLLFACYSLECN